MVCARFRNFRSNRCILIMLDFAFQAIQVRVQLHCLFFEVEDAMALDGGLHLPFGQRGWSGNEFDEGKEADYLHTVQARAQKRPWNM